MGILPNRFSIFPWVDGQRSEDEISMHFKENVKSVNIIFCLCNIYVYFASNLQQCVDTCMYLIRINFLCVYKLYS